jgi:hypothetical protein
MQDIVGRTAIKESVGNRRLYTIREISNLYTPYDLLNNYPFLKSHKNLAYKYGCFLFRCGASEASTT